MKESSLKILNDHVPIELGELSRRGLMQQLLGTVGTGLVLGHTMKAALTRAAAPDWQPIFFDSHQNETLIALAERIVPNSTLAQVNRFLDTLISVNTQENQKSFLASLGAFDHEGIARYKQPFNELAEDQQNSILTAASTARSSEPGQHGRRRNRPPAGATPGSEEPVPTLRDHFENIKWWVSRAFYSSEIGMKELGWTGQVAWESLPGCPHPDGQV